MRVQLNKRSVAAALPQQRPYEIRDAQVRGLLLRVQPSGHKAWIVTWTHGKRRTLGPAAYMSLEQARDLATTTIAEYIQTGLPSIAKPEPSKITFGEFLRDQYAPWARTELKGADKYVERLERVFADALTKPLIEIDARWVESWWTTRLQVKTPAGGLISKATAWRDLASLRAVVSKAARWDVLETNPLFRLRMKSVKSRSVVRFLSPAEEKRLRVALADRDAGLAAARTSANEWRRARRRPLFPEIVAGSYADHLSPIVLLAMNTGLRRGERLRAGP